MRAKLHPGAVTDLTGAGDWYESRRPGLGAELAEEVDRAIEVIRQDPGVWPRWPGGPADLEVRRFLLSRFPFAIPYLVLPGEVVILAVAHERRRPGYWADRLRSQ